MTKEHFRRIYALLPSKLEALCLKTENAIIYIFYGALTTLINYVVHFALRIKFSDIPEGEGLSEILSYTQKSGISSSGAAAAAWIAAVLFAFFTNKFFVFESKKKDGIIKELAVFAGGRLFSFGCELVIMWLFVDRMHMNELVIKLAASVFVLILNYFLSKFLVFKKKENT